NYYYALFNNNQDFTQLFKVVNGARITEALATATTDWLTDNAYHSIEVSRTGNDIRVRFDGSLIMSASDSTRAKSASGVSTIRPILMM
ncbi:MAG: hypothetical protein GXP17_02700, partial [Gammaproteobacteria bacterium]|nr:hypothetical protein [Gammaproteobacteria bacterium]